MRAQIIPAVLLLSLALAPAPAASEDLTEVTLSFYGCEGLYGVGPIPMADALELTPAGLTPVEFAPGFASAAFLGQRCARVTGDNGIDIDDYTELLHLIIVQADPQFNLPGALHTHAFAFRTNSPEVAAVYDAWNILTGDVLPIEMEIAYDVDDRPFAGTGTTDIPGFQTSVALAARTSSGNFLGTIFRVYGTDDEGNILNAADYDIKPGLVRLAGAAATFDPSQGVTTGATTGVSGLYFWGETELTQTMAYTPV